MVGFLFVCFWVVLLFVCFLGGFFGWLVFVKS